jgi:cystathionine gamma-synthase
MGGIAAVVSLVPVGGVVVVPRHAYNGDHRAARRTGGRGRLTVRSVEAVEVAAIVAEAAGADLLLLETRPTR